MALEIITSAVIVAWLFPMAFFLAVVIGYIHGRKRRVCTPDELIIQITTIGNAEIVNNAIRQIRAYGLSMAYRVWVVTEPLVDVSEYQGADRIIVVPENFTPRSLYKARAQEYVRRVRRDEGLDRREVKILFLDDDTLPTKNYIEAAFFADYDVCEGVITPSIGYGRFLSHIDDLRFLNCLMFCSVFQGFGQPLWVHGEGLCVRGDAEQSVTWDYPVFASEDLVFGHMARAKGLKWGFFHEHIHITSPWTLHAFLTQRRRWLWGNIHAVRYVLPLPVSALLITKYLLGFTTFFVAAIGILLHRLGMIDFSLEVRVLTFASLAMWLGLFAYAGWVNSGGQVKHALISMILAWITAAANILVLIVVFVQGNPRRFEVIEKVAPRKPVPTDPR